jgi:ABC-type branched-subunit amino acid transport system substrate-binding protein
MTSTKRIASAAAAVLALVCGGPVAAQIVIGQTTGFSGPIAAGAKENTDGARLYFDHVNRRGGVNGQRIELVSLDDKFQPKLAVENARKLINDHRVLALFLNRGTPHTEAIRPLLGEYKIALVGPSSGAMSLHFPVSPWIFNVRAPYQLEAVRAVKHLTSIGMNRIAVASVDDAFGADCVIGARKGFDEAGIEPVSMLRFDRDKPDFSAIAQASVKTNAQAVLFIGSSGAVADGTRALRAQGSQAQIVTLSNNASRGFVQQMGPNARGTIVAQVFPRERSLSAPIVKEAHDLAVAKGMKEVTPAMLEGYAAAKVLVEGLRKAGPHPTRQGLRDALEGLQRLDIGGLELSFSASSHTGLTYSDLAIIGPQGTFLR